MKLLPLIGVLLFSATAVSAQDSLGRRPDTVRVKNPVDTVETRDKYTRVILYDDFTWQYRDLGHPHIDSSLFSREWDTSAVHVFKNYPDDSIPETLDLPLADSLHHYYPPLQGKVGSGYAFRRTRAHKGIDIPLRHGDTIRAAFDGVVRFCGGGRRTGGYGNLVVLRHPNGLETYYGHLSKYIVQCEETVKAGEVLGYGGSTGRSTGPHLHFEVRYLGRAFDPQRIINFETGLLRDTLFTLHKHYFSIYSHYGQTDEESLAASRRIVHTVRPGDTLGHLAVKYNTTVDKICRLNHISRSTVLRIGRRLVVR